MGRRGTAQLKQLKPDPLLGTGQALFEEEFLRIASTKCINSLMRYQDTLLTPNLKSSLSNSKSRITFQPHIKLSSSRDVLQHSKSFEDYSFLAPLSYYFPHFEEKCSLKLAFHCQSVRTGNHCIIKMTSWWPDEEEVCISLAVFILLSNKAKEKLIWSYFRCICFLFAVRIWGGKEGGREGEEDLCPLFKVPIGNAWLASSINRHCFHKHRLRDRPIPVSSDAYWTRFIQAADLALLLNNN